MTSTKHHEPLDQSSLANGARHGVAAPQSPVAVRVRSRLGVMLMMVVVAAGVAGATLGLLVARREPTVAIAAAGVLVGVALVICFTIVVERRRLRRESEVAPTLSIVHAPVAVTNGNGNGSDWISEPTSGDPAGHGVRGQAELLEEILHWDSNGA